MHPHARGEPLAESWRHRRREVHRVALAQLMQPQGSLMRKDQLGVARPICGVQRQLNQIKIGRLWIPTQAVETMRNAQPMPLGDLVVLVTIPISSRFRLLRREIPSLRRGEGKQ